MRTPVCRLMAPLSLVILAAVAATAAGTATATVHACRGASTPVGLPQSNVAGTYVEAERFRAPSASSKIVSDAAASRGKAVQESQTRIRKNTIVVPANVLSALPTGSYQVFARVRTSACHVVVGGSAGWNANGVDSDSGVRVVATTKYTWLKLGRIRRTSSDQFLYVNIFRSGAAGSVKVDQMYVSPRL